MTDNRGFTLIELLSVIAILSVFTGVFAYNLGAVNGRAVAAAATGIVKSVNLAEASTQAYGDTTLTIYIENGTIRAEVSGNGRRNDSVISDNGCALYISMGEADDPGYSSEYTRMRSGDKITLVFDRSTGGIAETGPYVRNIRVVKGKYVKNVRLYPHTGKAEING